MGSTLNAIEREIVAATEADRPILRIRVTAEAVRGSIVTLPLTPERARLTALRMVEVRGRPLGVMADPEIERLLELVMHPDDWRDLLVEPEARGAVDFGAVGRYAERLSTPLARVLGVPVVL